MKGGVGLVGRWFTADGLPT